MGVLGIGQIIRLVSQHVDSMNVVRNPESIEDDDANTLQGMWWGCMEPCGTKREYLYERERRERQKTLASVPYGNPSFRGPYTVDSYVAASGPYATNNPNNAVITPYSDAFDNDN